MEQSFFLSEAITPSDELIRMGLGQAYPAFQALMERMGGEIKNFAPEWRYYNDAKCWLCKGAVKTKTVFWLAVYEGYFKLTFYFPERTLPALLELPIREELKNTALSAKRIGKSVPLTLDVYDMAYLEDLLVIGRHKASLK
ncbi:MAG: DUF3788 domain-containing protein [Oscillospiraceae bacterium]|nr:DUF3788 domain-containing protein [Oscillospiraceae bacterium]